MTPLPPRSPTRDGTVLHRLNRAEYGNADPRSARARRRRDVAAARRRQRVRFRQHRRRARRLAGADGALPLRGLEESAAWRSATRRSTPTVETFRVAVRPLAGRSHRRPADRHARRHPGPLHVSGRRRVRHPARGCTARRSTSSAASRSPHDLEVTFDGERVHLARFGGAEDEKANYLNPTAAGDELETAIQGPSAGEGRPAFRRRRVPEEELGADGRAAAAVPARAHRSDHARRDSRSSTRSRSKGRSTSRARAIRRAAAGSSPAGRRRRARMKRRARRTMLTTLARRAYRRPPSAAEVDRLLGFYQRGRKTGGTFDAGIENALAFMLVSPQFLFRFERDPDQVPADGVYRLSDLELASRLSFFIWSSIPDDQLLNLAVAGKLHTPGVLEQQVKRMLADERARALGGELRRPVAVPAQPEEPAARTRTSSRTSTTTCGRRCSAKRRCSSRASCSRTDSVLDLLDADYTFLNERLARHYGIPNVYGDQFRRVARHATTTARGLLGQGSILTLTSYGEPHVAGDARQVRADEHPRHAAAAAAAERAAARREAGQAAVDARAHGGAPREPRVRRLPQADGSDRPRARELRRDRPLARRATAASASTPPARSGTAPRSTGRPGCGRPSSAGPSSSRARRPRCC